MQSLESNQADPITTQPLTSHMGAVVNGVDLSLPISDAVFDRVQEEFLRHQLLVFRDQDLSPQNLIAFGRRFGDLHVHPLNVPTSGHPEIRVLSNIGDDGQLLPADEGPQNWHSELSYTPQPSHASVLYCVEIPEVGGGTEFADMHAAYEALPEAARRDLAGKCAVHDRNWRYARRYPDRPPPTAEEIANVPPTEQPVVRTHPVTGRRALYIYDNVVSHIVGMSEEESRPVIREIEAFATRPEFVYRHDWRVGDLVLWDDRCLLHRSLPHESRYRRVMLRTLVSGERPFFTALADD
jgi:taurine dioxygenase